MRCSNCGLENPEAARFCAGCGTATGRVCAKCGTPAVAAARFCIECGDRLDGATQAPVEPEPGPGPGGDAERRQLTVMFCDLKDSTRLAADLDPEDLGALNRAYRQACTAGIKRYDGYVARFMGDGVLAYFGYPQAHEDDADRAVRAGLDIVRTVPALGVDFADAGALAVRVGIATGPVVVGELVGEGEAKEHDVVGETPNLAARLQGLATENSVVIGEDTRRLLGAAFRFESLGERPLKGFGNPVAAWRVLGTTAAETRFEAARPGQLAPMVGREQELAIIENCWIKAEAGDGQVVLLSGEPGIGKSRITTAVRGCLPAAAHRDVRFQCSPYHRSSTLYPFVEHIRRAASFAEHDDVPTRLNKVEQLFDTTDPEVMAVLAHLLTIDPGDRYPPLTLDPDLLRNRTVEVLLGRLEQLAGHGTLLILVEDIHWADPSTLALLDILVERLIDLPAMLMITYRPEFEAHWAGEPHVALLSLNRLDRRQCERVIANVTGDTALPDEIVEQIALKTDGVPLFVEELTRAIIESDLVRLRGDRYELTGPLKPLAIPTTLKDSLMARLDQLDDAKSLAQTGAVIGREFSADLLEAVTGLDAASMDAAVSRLIDSGLVYRRGSGALTRYVFKHALVQDAAYNSLLKNRRRQIHGRIARVLAESFADTATAQPELLASHYAAAGMHREALPLWREAGRRAMERSAHEESISHFHRGLDSLKNLETDRANAAQTVELRISIAECLRIFDHLDEAFEALDDAQELAEKFDLDMQLARVHHQRGNLYFPMALTDRCLAEHQAALGYAQRAGSIEEEVRALGGLGDAHYVSGRMRTAKEYFSKSVELAQKNGFPKTAAANLSMRGFARTYLLELREALVDSSDAVDLARQVSLPRAELLAQILKYWILYHKAEFEASIECCDTAIEITRRLGARRFEAQNLNYKGLNLYGLGEKDTALEVLIEAERSSRDFSPNFTLVRVLGSIALVTDDMARRQRALDEAVELLDAGVVVSHNYFSFYMDAIDSCFDHGEWDRMEYFADRLEAYTSSEPLPWSQFIAERGRALAGSGRDGSGRRHAETLRRLLETARQSGFLLGIPRIQQALGEDPRRPEDPP